MINQTQQLVQFFSQLQVTDIAKMDEYYAVNAHFRDPFNDVTGLQKIQHLFAHMFEALDEPKFIIHTTVSEENRIVMTWDFDFQRKGKAYRLHGATLLHLNEAMKITEHLDYWDAANELYAKLPLVGGFMRLLQKLFRTPEPRIH